MIRLWAIWVDISKAIKDFFFFYLGFLSRTFTNHRTAGEGGGHFFNSSKLLPPASQTLRHYGLVLTKPFPAEVKNNKNLSLGISKTFLQRPTAARKKKRLAGVKHCNWHKLLHYPSQQNDCKFGIVNTWKYITNCRPSHAIKMRCKRY